MTSLSSILGGRGAKYPFLSREDLATNHDLFYIFAIRFVKTVKYGSKVYYDVVLDATGEKGTIPLGANEWRSGDAQLIRQHLTDHPGDLVGPCYLERGDQGQRPWFIQSVTDADASGDDDVCDGLGGDPSF